MSALNGSLENTGLQGLMRRAPDNVLGAIQKASHKSGVDFSYLVQQAAAESSFKADAKAKTSSATGLYQFIEKTWLSMVERYGDKHGIDTDGMSRKQVLDLRKDPETASFMAAEFASENERFLKTHWGGEIGSTELYFAHFLGAGQASSFLKARDENPMQPAADIFPRAAKANRNVFYDTTTGRAKSLEEVYAFFDKKFDGDVSVPVKVAQNERAPVPPSKASALVALDAGQARLNKLTHSMFLNNPNDHIWDGSQQERLFTARNGVPSALGSLVVNPVEVFLFSQMDDVLLGNSSLDEKDRT